jgi:hypothetical protein
MGGTLDRAAQDGVPHPGSDRAQSGLCTLDSRLLPDGSCARLMSTAAPILVVTKRLPPAGLAKLIGEPFPDMVKFVVDVELRIIAVGGQLHADAEAILLERGSPQASLWGGNYHPGLGEVECIEYESLINIRPAVGNLGLDVQDPAIREKIRDVVFALIGRGEPLP